MAISVLVSLSACGMSGGENTNAADTTAAAITETPTASQAVSTAASPVVGAHIKPENYPKSPISLIVGAAAGGATDIMTRALAESMIIDTPVNVINRTGASGTTAAAEVAVAKPDGYNINIGIAAAYYIQPHMNDLTYDTF